MAAAFVQQGATYNATAALTEAVTLTGVGAGNTLFIASIIHPANTNTVTCPGNTVIVGAVTATLANVAVKCWIIENATGGTMTVTLTSNGQNLNQLYVAEISGTSKTGCYLGGGGINTGGTGSVVADAVATSAISVTAQPAMLIGICHDSQTVSVAAGTGFTALTRVWGSGAISAQPEYKRVTATGTPAMTWTANATNKYDQYYGIAAALKEGTASMTGTASSGEVQSSAAAGLELIGGPASGTQAQSVAASGAQAMTGPASGAQAQSVAGTGTAILNSGTASGAQAETVDATGLLAIAGSASSLQAETEAATGILAIIGALAQSQGQTSSGAGTQTSPTGAALSAQAQSISAAGRETIPGSAASSEAQSSAGSGLERLSGTTSGGQAQSSGLVGLERMGGMATSSEAQSAGSAGALSIPGAAGSTQGQSGAAVGTVVSAGTCATAQSQSASGTGQMGFVGTANSSEAQSAAASGASTVTTGSANSAQVQSSSALGAEVVPPASGTAVSAQAQSGGASGTEGLSATAQSGQAQTDDATGSSLVAAPITGTATSAQSCGTADGNDRPLIVQISGGGGAGTHPLFFYKRPTLHLPRKLPRIVGQAESAQSEQTDGTGQVTPPAITGYATSMAASTVASEGTVDNRRPINERRAKILVALLKAA